MVLEGATTLRVARGQRVLEVDLSSGRPDDAELLSLLLGRSGKLRAPTLRIGGTVLVGYNEQMMQGLLG